MLLKVQCSYKYVGIVLFLRRKEVNSVPLPSGRQGGEANFLEQ